MKRLKSHVVDKWVHVAEMQGVLDSREKDGWVLVIIVEGGVDIATLVWGK